jgi:hypothetical protein
MITRGINKMKLPCEYLAGILDPAKGATSKPRCVPKSTDTEVTVPSPRPLRERVNDPPFWTRLTKDGGGRVRGNFFTSASLDPSPGPRRLMKAPAATYPFLRPRRAPYLLLNTGFVSGHGFSRADRRRTQ